MAGVMSISVVDADGSTGIEKIITMKNKRSFPQVPPITRSSYPKVLVSPSFSTFEIEEVKLWVESRSAS